MQPAKFSGWLARTGLGVVASLLLCGTPLRAETLLLATVREVLVLPVSHPRCEPECPNLDRGAEVMSCIPHSCGCAEALLEVSDTVIGAAPTSRVTAKYRIYGHCSVGLPIGDELLLVRMDGDRLIDWSEIWRRSSGQVLFEARRFERIGGVEISSLPQTEGQVDLADLRSALPDALRPGPRDVSAAWLAADDGFVWPATHAISLRAWSTDALDARMASALLPMLESPRPARVDAVWRDAGGSGEQELFYIDEATSGSGGKNFRMLTRSDAGWTLGADMLCDRVGVSRDAKPWRDLVCTSRGTQQAQRSLYVHCGEDYRLLRHEVHDLA